MGVEFVFVQKQINYKKNIFLSKFQIGDAILAKKRIVLFLKVCFKLSMVLMGSEGEMTVFKLIGKGGNGQVVKCLDLQEVGLRKVNVMNEDVFRIT